MSNAIEDQPSLFEGLDEVRGFLDAWCESQREIWGDKSLIDAVRYALLGGGKMLRPALAMRCCEAVGAEAGNAVFAGAAVEMIHAFSLVHDDLPAMDDDDLRRGRPTLHVHAGEAMAILAGDALATLPFGVLVDGASSPEMGAALVTELTRGAAGMIHGQVLDTIGAIGSEPNEDDVRRVHTEKTGALITAACRMGAICGGSTPEQLASISRFSDSIGLMFQVVDDLLDVEQEAEQTGKRTGKDAEAGKLTYPGILGVPGAKARVEALLGESLGAIDQLERDAGDGRTLRSFATYLAGRTK